MNCQYWKTPCFPFVQTSDQSVTLDMKWKSDGLCKLIYVTLLYFRSFTQTYRVLLDLQSWRMQDGRYFLAMMWTISWKESSSILFEPSSNRRLSGIQFRDAVFGSLEIMKIIHHRISLDLHQIVGHSYGWHVARDDTVARVQGTNWEDFGYWSVLNVSLLWLVCDQLIPFVAISNVPRHNQLAASCSKAEFQGKGSVIGQYLQNADYYFLRKSLKCGHESCFCTLRIAVSETGISSFAESAGM